MINIILYGRLGNNLFQIATAYSLAKSKNQECYFLIDKDICNLYNFLDKFRTNVLRNIYDKIIDINDIKDKCTIIKEESYFYKDLSNTPDNVILDGYFQSYKYFDKKVITELFKPTDSIINEIYNKYPQIKSERLTGINVRRGDYLSILDKYPLCLMNYFKLAAGNVYNETDIFIICSDDIAWCKKNFGESFFNKPVIYVENQEIHIQFYTLTLCKNIIISNSTFSWWAAYLNKNENCKVFCPKSWYFGYDSSRLSAKDLIPPSWIKVSNKLTIEYYIPYIKCFWKNRILINIKKLVKNVIRKH